VQEKDLPLNRHGVRDDQAHEGHGGVRNEDFRRVTSSDARTIALRAPSLPPADPIQKRFRNGPEKLA
jgi:hypothetical protein